MLTVFPFALGTLAFSSVEGIAAPPCFNAGGAKDKTLRIITAEEGGSQHCQNDRLGVAIPYMHDWLAEKLKA